LGGEKPGGGIGKKTKKGNANEAIAFSALEGGGREAGEARKRSMLQVKVGRTFLNCHVAGRTVFIVKKNGNGTRKEVTTSHESRK